MRQEEIWLFVSTLLCIVAAILLTMDAEAQGQDCDPCKLGPCFNPAECEQFKPTPGCFIPGAECTDERVFIDCEFDRATLDALYGKDVGFLCDDANLLFKEGERYFERSQRKSRKIKRLRRRLQRCERS